MMTVRHCGLVESEQVVSSIPGSVGYISHVHRTYKITRVPLRFSWYIWIDTKLCLKNRENRENDFLMSHLTLWRV